MSSVLACLLVLALVGWGTWKAGKSNKTQQGSGSGCRTVRCPNCGAQAKVRGNTWECGFCGDFGTLNRKS